MSLDLSQKTKKRLYTINFKPAVFLCLVHFGPHVELDDFLLPWLHVNRPVADSTGKDNLRSVCMLHTQYMVRLGPRIHSFQMMMIPLNLMYICDN